MGNLTSLGSVSKLIDMGLEAVESSRGQNQRDFGFSMEQNNLNSDLVKRLQRCSVVVVGCKTDMIDKAKT